MRLLLFDIDGTLMDSGGAGLRSLRLAFHEVLGLYDAISGEPKETLAGRTDLAIIHGELAMRGIASGNGLVPELMGSYVRHLSTEIMNGESHIKPGVVEALDAASALDGVGIGLLTGNVMEGARIKLNSLGLWDYFGFGAFGDDSHDRDRLLPFAVERHRALTGGRGDHAKCMVIGDTPRDIQCARPYGAHALAVATGHYSADDLRRAGADIVFSSMTDPGFIECLLNF